MSSVNPKKLKVLELKRELEQRSIQVSKSMKKAELVALLVSALESEAGQEKVHSAEVSDCTLTSGSEKDKQEESQQDEQNLYASDQIGKSIEQAPDSIDFKDQRPTKSSGEEASNEKDDHVEKSESQEHIQANPQVEELPSTYQDVSLDGQCNEDTSYGADSSETGANQELGLKRKHEENPDDQNIWEERQQQLEEADEGFDDSLVVLDAYNSDLNFKISRDCISGQPLSMEGFAFLWAGVRATHGVTSGKVCYECKVAEEDPVKHLPSDEQHPHVVRVGWSADYSSLQLGEDASSYGYGGTGKFSTCHSFSDYGETFCAGDVIGCYINFSGEDHIEISFSKNGVFQGIAFTGTNPHNKALFPHVLCKNTSVELNFGQRETPHHAVPVELEGYVFLSCVPLEKRVRAVKGPQSKAGCEVLMMCGLPGAGKTYYCRQKMKDEPEKKYNVLGTNIIMEKMRVMGVARKKNYAGRWDLLIDNATQCLNRLLQIACRKHRNYILDQTNVYASAQRRKMRPFEGFQRKAIVVVPTEEDYKMRFEKRTDDEGKEVPEMAILGMKANFTLPEVGSLFDEVIFTELGREEARKVVDKYRDDGRKHGPPAEKRLRGDNRHRSRDNSWRRGRNLRMQQGFMNETSWGKLGSPVGMARGSFARGFNRVGGYGGRQPGFGARGRDYGFVGRRDDYSHRNERSSIRGKSGWIERGGRGNRGTYESYSRHQQTGRGNLGFPSGETCHGNHSIPNQVGRLPHNSTQSFAPQSAQAYTYGHNQQYNAQSARSISSSGYGNVQQNSPQGAGIAAAQQGQVTGFQQSFGQQDYSQQWAHFYQQQAQVQQYQNYFNYQQQYYNQQSASQVPRQ